MGSPDEVLHPGEPRGNDKDDVNGLPDVFVEEIEPDPFIGVECADDGEKGDSQDVYAEEDGQAECETPGAFAPGGREGNNCGYKDGDDFDGATGGDEVEGKNFAGLSLRERFLQEKAALFLEPVQFGFRVLYLLAARGGVRRV